MNKGRYRHEVPVDLTAPPPASAQSAPVVIKPRVAPHPQGCWCTACWNAGLRYGEWKEQKRLDEL